MAENWKDTLTDKLCDAFLKLETRQEVYDFLEDVATIGEIKALSQRLEVARLLSRAKTYPRSPSRRGRARPRSAGSKNSWTTGPAGTRSSWTEPRTHNSNSKSFVCFVVFAHLARRTFLYAW